MSLSSDIDAAGNAIRAPTRLKRALGLRIATAVVVGNMIGSGIFLKPGNIAGNCGQFGLIIALWVAGGVLCLLGALCVAELATMLPHAGGCTFTCAKPTASPSLFCSAGARCSSAGPPRPGPWPSLSSAR